MKRRLLMSTSRKVTRMEPVVMSMRKNIDVILEGLAKAGLVDVPRPTFMKENAAVQSQLDTAVHSSSEPVADSREQCDVLNTREIVVFKFEPMSAQTRQHVITVSYDEIKHSVLIEFSAGEKPDDTGELGNADFQRENSGHDKSSSSVGEPVDIPKPTGEEPRHRAERSVG